MPDRPALPACLLCLAMSFSAQLPAAAQTPQPEIAQSAVNASGFTPGGWRLEYKVEGDLNKDEADDLVVVLRQEHEPPAQAGQDGNAENFDPLARILLIAFRDETTGRYHVAAQNQAIVPIRTSPNQDDFLGEAGGLSIKNGVLNVQINLFMSAGGWDAGSRTFRFRHQGGQFKLIGFDSSNVHRGSGETTDVSVNFLNRKTKIATGSIENDIVKTKWSRLPKQPLLTIQQVGNGLEFEPGL